MPLNDVILVAIDNGFYNTKVYTYKDKEVKQYSFRSKYEITNDSLNEKNTVHFKLDDEDYIVGDGATQDNIEKDKTNNELHKIITYRVLSELSNCIGTEFFLVVGYPLTLVSNEKQKFIDYLVGDNNEFIETEFEHEKKIFKINDCIVLPQGAGALFSDSDKLKDYENKIQGVIDIGGLTVNGVIYDNLNIVRNSIFTEDLGMIILYEKIRNKLYSLFSVSIQDYQMPYIINNGLNNKNKYKSLEVINEIMREHVNEIKKQVMKNKWDIENTDIHFVGGGSIILKKYINELFPHSTVTDNIFDNVKGFYNIGAITYGYN